MGQLHVALVLASCMLFAVAQGQPTESYGDMISRVMDEHKERAIARWTEERAHWEAMLAQANHGRALKSAWVARPVNNTGPVKYVDLSQWPSELKSSVGLKAAFNWNAKGARWVLHTLLPGICVYPCCIVSRGYYWRCVLRFITTPLPLPPLHAVTSHWQSLGRPGV